MLGWSELAQRAVPSPFNLGTPVPGIRLVAIANRTPAHAERAFREAGITRWSRVGSAREAEAEIARGVPVSDRGPYRC